MAIQFEWDEEKADSNKRKHGIDFITATKIFWDNNRIEIFDKEHSSENEDRYITIGKVEEILFVVYTERKSRIRLISARLATARERRLYYGGFTTEIGKYFNR